MRRLIEHQVAVRAFGALNLFFLTLALGAKASRAFSLALCDVIATIAGLLDIFDHIATGFNLLP